MKYLLAGVISGCFAWAAQSSAATPFMYECTIHSKKRMGGWIPQRVAVVQPPKGKLQVIDDISIQFEQSPVTVKVRRSNDQILSISWKVKTRDSQGQGATMDYYLRLKHESGKVVVGAQPSGYPNAYSGRGTCKLRDK